MKHARILIIEDDTDTADMLKIFFSSQGSSVEIAPTGEKALNAVKQSQPDLILLDILLPDMDGYAICQKLRSSSNSRHIPILFLTQKNSRNDIISGLEIGADDYLTKPFDLEELKLRVRNALNRSRTYRQIDARTSLPTGDLILHTLSRLIARNDWAALLVRIKEFEHYQQTGRLRQQDELLGRMAARLENILRDLDEQNPFVGYLSGGDFLLVTKDEDVKEVMQACLKDQQDGGSDLEESKSEQHLEEPALVQLRLESTGEAARIELDVGVKTAWDGPFESPSALLDALYHSLNEHKAST
ncbi:MAG: response regulator transcription factor [Anaerolineales bacterium]|jgi:DNA-binding response OmpR family regulator